MISLRAGILQVFLLAALLAPSSGQDATGTLDTSFGQKGWVLFEPPSGEARDSRGRDVAIDGKGRVLVTGDIRKGPEDTDMVLWRLTPEGALDPGFGSGGLLVHDGEVQGESHDSGKAIRLDSEGRVLVTGSVQKADGGWDMTVWRFRDDGTPDPTFGEEGIARGGDRSGRAIAVDASGRYVVAGFCGGGRGFDLKLWRLDASGKADGSFGDGGTVTAHDAAGGSGTDFCMDLALDSKGRILAAGWSYRARGDREQVVWRFLPSGSPDEGFGAKGVFVRGNVAGGNDRDFIQALAVDDKDRAIAVGVSTGYAGEDHLTLLRLTPEGALDTTFGQDGVVLGGRTIARRGAVLGTDVVLDDRGRILVSGSALNPAGHSDLAVRRFLETGEPDLEFGRLGVALHDGARGEGSHEQGYGLALDGSGRVVVTGYSHVAWDAPHMGVWRFR
jgi:uncharacterized delta-60 repeat protein